MRRRFCFLRELNLHCRGTWPRRRWSWSNRTSWVGWQPEKDGSFCEYEYNFVYLRNDLNFKSNCLMFKSTLNFYEWRACKFKLFGPCCFNILSHLLVMLQIPQKIWIPDLSAIQTIHNSGGLEPRTCLDFGWSKIVQMLNTLVFKFHS